MTDEIMNSFGRVFARLVELAIRDDVLRGEVRALAGTLLKATEHGPGLAEQNGVAGPGSILGVEEASAVEPADAVEVAPEPDLPVQVPATVAPAPKPIPRAPLPPLTLGAPPPPKPISIPDDYRRLLHDDDEDLAALEARCRLKAEGVRWSAERRRLIDEDADFQLQVAPKDREILDRARALPNCMLWMNSPSYKVALPAAMEEAALCFEVVADGVELARRLMKDAKGNRGLLERVVNLLAAAQSALRTAVDNINGYNDSDQFKTYDWLRTITKTEEIYIPRHMRLDDPAPPSDGPKLKKGFAELAEQFDKSKNRVKIRESRFKKLRYHANLIREGNGSQHDWDRVAQTIDELAEDGTPPSDVGFRETLLPIIDSMPELEPVPRGLALVLGQIDRYLASREPEAEKPREEAPNPEIARVAELLEGRSIVLIGGERRRDAEDHLKQAFALKDLIWVESRGHESISLFEPYVARPDVELVLLAIRWASHSFGDVKHFCKHYGKPLVRLPGGYSPNQVAVQILNQCSDQLGRE